MARTPFLEAGRLGHGDLAKVTAGQDWEKDPGVLTHVFTCSLPLLQDTGHPSLTASWDRHTTQGTPSSSKGDAMRYPMLPSEDRGCLLPVSPSLSPSWRAGAAGSCRAHTLVLLRTSPTKVETSKDPGMEVRGRSSL